MAQKITDDIQEISREGFQVVSGEIFKSQYRVYGEPTVTLWSNSISFGKGSLTALNNCERVRLEVNTKTMGLLIIPVTAKDKDSVRWSKNVKDPVPRKIECSRFTRPLFETWKWNADHVYRAVGRIVTADKKVMLLFDFSKAENWKQPLKKGKTNG